jgi:hypothetical protein
MKKPVQIDPALKYINYVVEKLVNVGADARLTEDECNIIRNCYRHSLPCNHAAYEICANREIELIIQNFSQRKPIED